MCGDLLEFLLYAILCAGHLLEKSLTPCPAAEKRHPHHGSGCTRLRATTIVGGIQA